MQEGHGSLKLPRMTGKGKEQSAGAAEQTGTDHPDRHGVKLPIAEKFFRDGAGKKAPPTRSDACPAQAIALFTRRDNLEQSGIDIAALLQNQVLTDNAVQVAFRGNCSQFSLDPFTGEVAVENVDQDELP